VVGDGYDGQGNEVLTYIEGEIINPHPWSDEAIWRVGRLLRQLHDATASFRPPPEAVWQPWYFHSDTPGSISATATPAPGTSWPVMACRWPSSTGPWPGPTDRRDEVAATGWWNAQLHDDDIAEANHRADAVTRGAQLRQFLDGYGLPAAEGPALSPT
jgi:hypothetical protein